MKPLSFSGLKASWMAVAAAAGLAACGGGGMDDTGLAGAQSVATHDVKAQAASASAGMADWADNEVPVLIMLGQSNTDGRAVYSFSDKPDDDDSRVAAYPGGASNGEFPCALQSHATGAACKYLDLRTIHAMGGKAGDGTGAAMAVLDSPTELALLGKLLRKEASWNANSAGQDDNRVRMYVTRFAINGGSSHRILHASDGSYDRVTNAAFRDTNLDPQGWWELLHPMKADGRDTPAHLMNSIVGSPTWNGKNIFGPEVALAIKWRANVGNKPLYIIKLAVGGSSLASTDVAFKHWGTAEDSIWQTASRTIDKAVSAFYATGKKPRLIGVYWGQGESDEATSSDEYAGNLAALMQRVRANIGVGDAKFIVQKLYDTGTDGSRTIRAAQSQVCTAQAKCSLISLDAYREAQKRFLRYPIGNEAVHYTAHAQVLIGAQIYEKLRYYVDTAKVIPKP